MNAIPYDKDTMCSVIDWFLVCLKNIGDQEIVIVYEHGSMIYCKKRDTGSCPRVTTLPTRLYFYLR